MVDRKKRLEKGIESISEQIKIHENKKKIAEEQGNSELSDYYKREIAKFQREKEKKEKIIYKN